MAVATGDVLGAVDPAAAVGVAAAVDDGVVVADGPALPQAATTRAMAATTARRGLLDLVMVRIEILLGQGFQSGMEPPSQPGSHSASAATSSSVIRQASSSVSRAWTCGSVSTAW